MGRTSAPQQERTERGVMITSRDVVAAASSPSAQQPQRPEPSTASSNDNATTLGAGDASSPSSPSSSAAPPAAFCLNCTSRIDDDCACEACGHCTAADDELLLRPAGAACAPACRHAAQGQAVALLYDERMTLHDEGEEAETPHPERPDRIRAVVGRLLASGLAAHCQRVPCRAATLCELRAVHTQALVHMVSATASAAAGGSPGASFAWCPSISPDMYTNAHTFLCARLAAGGAAEVASLVARGQAPHAAAIVRPPGHHAESGLAQGFCFFNNAAVAARAAQAAGARRVLLLDWDIHHGNGTQQIFEHDPSVLYMSLHRYDSGQFYPGTGAAHDVGLGRGRGFSVNVPFETAGLTDGDYLAAFDHVLLPIACQFRPDLVLVSAGFDAAEGDPIGECCVTPAGFAHMTAALKAVGPVVLLLEGGYNLAATAMSTEACLRVLMGDAPSALPSPRSPSPAAWQCIHHAMAVQSRFWACMKHALPTHQRQHWGGLPDQHWGQRHHAGAWGLDGDDRDDMICVEVLGSGVVRGASAAAAVAAGPARRGARVVLSRRARLGALALRAPIGRGGLAAAVQRRAIRCFWSRQRGA